MQIVRENKKVYRSVVERAVGKDATGKEVLDYLFGDWKQDPEANFFIIEWCYDYKRKPWQRANMLWVLPLTVLCAPYQYIRHGYVGWTNKTKFSRWILRVTGHLR